MSLVKEKVEQIVSQFLESRGFDLIEINMSKKNNSFMVQVLTDKPKGGIIVDECVRLNREIREILEKENLITDDCFFEVASPGLDRDIQTKKDFLRVGGREISVYLKEAVDGKIEYQGIMKSVMAGAIRIICNNDEVVLPFKMINKAKQII
ncbi:MAG: hypothetical protein P9M12_03830 [Candidatus Aceula lacicola]|nr:hypothetical protein [Candidatus Aceula lacicola]